MLRRVTSGPIPESVPGPALPSRAACLWRTWVVRTMWVLVALYVGALAVHLLDWSPVQTGWYDNFIDGFLGTLTVWVPAAVCWSAVRRIGRGRPEILLAAIAVTSFTAGDTYYILANAVAGSVPFPSPADVGYLLVYPLLLAALILMVQRHARSMVASVWLDCAVGSLGAAAVLAVILAPVLDSTTAGPFSAATFVAVAPPAFDLVLLAAVAGISVLRGARMESRWAALVGGLLVFSVADVLYGLDVSTDSYIQGTPLDAAWAIGLALLAMWVDGSEGPGLTAEQPNEDSRSATLAVSALATLAGLVVLVVATQLHLSALAVSLAAITLLAAGGRAQLSVRQLGRMADQRQLAADTDELTGLPNRRALYEAARTRLSDPRRRRQALLMLDLDNFKVVNDTLGHHAGDLLLMQTASRLRDSLRGNDVLARLGGDEFAILLDDVGGDGAVTAASRLCDAVGQPFAIDGGSLISSVSIGIARFPEDGLDLSELLRKADLAMYKAKSWSMGHHVYSPIDDPDNESGMRTVDEMRTFISSDQLVLHYQPKVDLTTREVHSVEALVRWAHPTRGLLFPDAFLSQVEEAGLMPSLTRAVLSVALDQAVTWSAQGRLMTVAVNVSASSLVDTDLPAHVASMLASRGLPGKQLLLEITEDFLLTDRDRARAILAQVRALGVQISIDDYGTGYSSLSYLRDLPIDELKLDRSFIVPMTNDSRTLALVSSTIELAHSLGLRMVAEGVETAMAYTELTRLGCDQAQGYLLSKPVTATELDHWLERRPAAEPLLDPAEL
mgnify:CR=1 FL=1